jgi:MFS family permease
MNTTIKRAPVLAAGFSGMIFFGVAFVIMGAVLPSLIEKFQLDTTVASTLAGLLPLGILLGSVLFGPVIDRCCGNNPECFTDWQPAYNHRYRYCYCKLNSVDG